MRRVAPFYILGFILMICIGLITSWFVGSNSGDREGAVSGFVVGFLLGTLPGYWVMKIGEPGKVFTRDQGRLVEVESFRFKNPSYTDLFYREMLRRRSYPDY
jgi:hypothetical protein